VKTLVIYDSSLEGQLKDWAIVNDVVMGGKSKSEVYKNRKGNLVFEGFVSLENNGGFCSIRNQFDSRDISAYNSVLLRIKGDGKTYQLRVKKRIGDVQSYIYNFKTENSWQNINIPLNLMYPSFRGRRLPYPNFPGKEINEISILIGGKKEGSFKLIIDQIELY
jgi:hypothetical protein